ncbi:Inosine/uridine-preferring nucleoside hydrolase domain-containing protein [Gymnopilus junonius]|uniref:Inosine/uridine-preferring nucleoside hydrolase domain-containing protein n=1 Tax=Gymnopilus junonius TaxID=109634 RepID=A0A9P5P528_GYMJU|nr:Inosine/uridine-preferring nucleoside hydrolase domain-containing protein [Gymnopilus junonius]
MKYVWLDVDPGHDDATAIMLAVNTPGIHLLGVSTTHGNASSNYTAINAARCLLAFGAPTRIRVYPGADEPLLLPAKHDPEIHGVDGLGGVEGLPEIDRPEVLSFFAEDEDGSRIRALEGMSSIIKETWKKGAGNKVTVISSGPMTNIALFVSAYSDLLVAVEEFVFMGGGVGMGNRSSVAEYNILCDPHAAQIVLNAPVKKTMIPINVTHTAIVTKAIHTEILSPAASHEPLSELPKASTNLRHTLSTLINFFADSYRLTFGFKDGPPLHDALTIAYVAYPSLFKCTRHRVDIELTGVHTTGETVVDLWNYRTCDDSWGRNGRNCMVAEQLDVKEFFDIFLETISRCDNVSPLNRQPNPQI